jgi:sugar lactone lactonase YvrE
MFNLPMGIALDVAGDLFYVADYQNHRIAKFVLSTGAYVGSIGNSTGAAGTCPAGPTNAFCTGSTFTFASTDGSFSFPFGVAINATQGYLYVSDVNNFRIQRIDLNANGASAGSIGRLSASTGTCPASGAASSW